MKRPANSKYDVKMIVEAIRQIDKTGNIESFLTECQRAGLKMSVPTQLRDLSVHYLNGNIGAEAIAPDTDCPMCPRAQ